MKGRNTHLFLYLFMHSLVDSCTCPDQGLNLKLWCIEMMLLPTEYPSTALPRHFHGTSFLKVRVGCLGLVKTPSLSQAVPLKGQPTDRWTGSHFRNLQTSVCTQAHTDTFLSLHKSKHTGGCAFYNSSTLFHFHIKRDFHSLEGCWVFHCADLTGPHWVGTEEDPIFCVTSKLQQTILCICHFAHVYYLQGTFPKVKLLGGTVCALILSQW